MFCSERYGITEAGTKSGKTVSAIAWLVEQALQGQQGWNYWWVAPGYQQAEIAYRRIKLGLTKGSFTPFDTPTPRIHTMAGTWIWFKSADNADALYGEDVYSAVIDEASRCPEPSWHAVRSTLTATRGPIRLIGNVKGRRNWFFILARKAEAMMLSEPNPAKRSMHYSMITADDAVDAGVLDRDEIEDARATLPEKIFRELYYNEPGDDTGNPFGLEHIRACSIDDLAPGPVVAWGIDLAKKHDYFVIIGLNAEGAVAGFHRWNRIPWRASIRKSWAITGEDTPVLVDSTGLGDPVLEELQYEHGNFQGYTFSPTSKQKLMEGLSISIQSHELRFPKGFITQELESFEYQFTRTGFKYSAPEGQFDDCVAALALARQMWSQVAPGANVMKFYEATATQLRQEQEAMEGREDNRPWQTNLPQVTPSDIIENELNALYEETLRKSVPQMSRNCAHCGKPVLGPSRVSDGERFWHLACAGTMAPVVMNAVWGPDGART